jgi:hypothetical protein
LKDAQHGVIPNGGFEHHEDKDFDSVRFFGGGVLAGWPIRSRSNVVGNRFDS